MTDGWGGDPGHTGAQPMKHLQGGMAAPNVQAPMESENSGPSRDAGATTGEIAGWQNTVIGSGSGGGSHLNPANSIKG